LTVIFVRLLKFTNMTAERIFEILYLINFHEGLVCAGGQDAQKFITKLHNY